MHVKFTAKYMDIEPLWIAMNSSHVFAASRDNFLLWHYRTPKSRSTFSMAGMCLTRFQFVLGVHNSCSIYCISQTLRS